MEIRTVMDYDQVLEKPKDRRTRLLALAGFWLVLTSNSASGYAQSNLEALPAFAQVLAECRAVADAMPDDLTKAYLLRRIAALEARSGDIDAAFRTLDAIRLSDPDYGQTAKNLQEVGLREMLEALARSGQADIAVRVAESLPSQYATQRDQGLGTIAIVQAERNDAAGAKRTLARMKARTDYNYPLQVAMRLNDKAMARRVIRSDIEKSAAAPPESFRLFSREQWAYAYFWLTILKWCGEHDEANRYLDRVSQASQLTDEMRQSLEEEFAKPIDGPLNPCPPEARQPKPTPAQIVEKLAAARGLKDAEDRGDSLLAVADMLLAIRPATPPPNRRHVACGSHMPRCLWTCRILPRRLFARLRR